MNRSFIGADPGKQGGISIIFSNGLVSCFKMPESLRDLCDLVESFKSEDFMPHAFIEKVHAVKGNGISSTFTFGMGFGSLLTAFTAAKIPFSLVTPQKWQKELGCLTGGDKNISKARAQQLFPHIKVTHAIADSLLIAEYCRRTIK